MPYLIDSDIVIDHLAQAAQAGALLTRLSLDGIAISVISYMEIYQGVVRSSDRQRAEAEFEELLVTTPILSFSPAIARRCAELREQLRSERKRVRARALDLMIAATAIEHGLTLVTRNTDDYADIPGLDLYAWDSTPRR
jgi:tRNA(fMet)-specific endonuclease VapC